MTPNTFTHRGVGGGASVLAGPDRDAGDSDTRDNNGSVNAQMPEQRFIFGWHVNRCRSGQNLQTWMPSNLHSVGFSITSFPGVADDSDPHADCFSHLDWGRRGTGPNAPVVPRPRAAA